MTENGENLQASTQQYKHAHISRRVIKSKAFLSLRTAAACQVYLICLTKHRLEKAEMRLNTHERKWIAANNGRIEFTYKEARETYGISGSRFTQAIDALVEVGLLDITKQGSYMYKDHSIYAISDRWKNYGTHDFVKKARTKHTARRGFTEANEPPN